jgi:RNA polymerase sigma factor (sigma-70 family)
MSVRSVYAVTNLGIDCKRMSGQRRRPPPRQLRAWLEAYGKLQPRARTRYLQGSNEAEDSLHDAYLRVLDKDSPVKDRPAYMARAAHNVAVSAARRKRRAIVFFDSEKMNEAVETRPEMRTPDMSDDLAAKQKLEAIVRRIPDYLMRSYFLCKQLGFSYEEAAAHLGISAEAVHKHVVEFRKRCVEMEMEWRDGGTDK